MNNFMLFLKIIQVFLSLVIFILFLVPQDLTVNENAFQRGKTGPAARINPQHMVCFKPTQGKCHETRTKEFKSLKILINQTAEGVQASCDSVPMHFMMETLLCLEQSILDQNDKNVSDKMDPDKCFCWNSFYILAFVIWSFLSLILSSCDAYSIYAGEGHSERTTYFQALSSCICSAFVGIAWKITGAVILHFTQNAWPYIYEVKDDPNTFLKFYLVPTSYYVAVLLCFSFAFVMLLEGVAYFARSRKYKGEEPRS